MSFMYNPFPYDDPKPINRPELSKETIDSVVTGGTPNVAKKFFAERNLTVVPFASVTTVKTAYKITQIARSCTTFELVNFFNLDMFILLNQALQERGRSLLLPLLS